MLSIRGKPTLTLTCGFWAPPIGGAERQAEVIEEPTDVTIAEHNSVRPLARCSRADHSCACPAARNDRLVSQLLPLRCLTNKTKGNLRCYVLRPSLPGYCSRSAWGWLAPSVLARPPPRPTPTVSAHTEQFVATVVSVDMTTRDSGAEDTGRTANHGRRWAGCYQPRTS